MMSFVATARIILLIEAVKLTVCQTGFSGPSRLPLSQISKHIFFLFMFLYKNTNESVIVSDSKTIVL